VGVSGDCTIFGYTLPSQENLQATASLSRYWRLKYDIDISQGSVAMLILLRCKFIGEYGSERIVKIGQYLTRLCVHGLPAFLTHLVCRSLLVYAQTLVSGWQEVRQTAKDG